MYECQQPAQSRYVKMKLPWVEPVTFSVSCTVRDNHSYNEVFV